MKIKRFISIVVSLVLLSMGICDSASAENSESIAQSITILPYKQIKYVRSTGILSGISPETSFEEVINCFDNCENIKAYSNGEQVKSGNVATGWQFKSGSSDETATAIIYGDINSDSSIDLADVLKSILYCASVEDLDKFQKMAMDINKDGEQNTKDCLMLKQHLAGWFNLRNSSYYYVSKDGTIIMMEAKNFLS